MFYSSDYPNPDYSADISTMIYFRGQVCLPLATLMKSILVNGFNPGPCTVLCFHLKSNTPSEEFLIFLAPVIMAIQKTPGQRV